MKILIINPPAYNKKDYIREGRCMQTKSSWAALWMPLSLAYTAAFLRQDGYNILLIDCIAEKINNKDLLELAEKFSPELIIVNTAFPSIKGDMETVSLIKNSFPSPSQIFSKNLGGRAKIAIIGLYPTLLEKRSLKEFNQADFAVVGEPEWVVKNLSQALENDNPLEKINGLVYRRDGEIKINLPQDLSKNDINQLPFPARDLLNNGAYCLPTNGEKFTLLSVGRGCPYNCSFCVANLYYGKKFRKREVDSIVNEIEECLNKYRIKNFLFWGESFSIDSVYGEKICDEIIKRNLKITWATASRVDTLNKQLLEKMKKAGCHLLSLGIESFNQKIIDLTHKNISLEQIEKAIALVKKAGINSMGHFIFGLPGETKKTAKKTIKWACQSSLNYAQFYCVVPYPKTELGRIAKENNWIKMNNFSQFDLTKSVMRNENLTAKEIKKLRDKAYFKFYFRPKMFFQTIKEVNSLKSFLSALNFLKWIKPKK